MSDDLDMALGLDGGFGRPKKRSTAPVAKPQVEAKAPARTLPAAAIQNAPLEEARATPLTVEVAPMAEEGESVTAKGSLRVPVPVPDISPTQTAPGIQAKSFERSTRRQAASSDARYGKLISLRVPSNLFEDLERKGEEMGAKTVGQFLVAVLKIALSDPSMLAAPDLPPIYSAATGMTATERLRATFAQKASTEASRQMTIRLDMASVSKLSAAAKTARVKERAPFILAIIERQLRAL